MKRAIRLMIYILLIMFSSSCGLNSSISYVLSDTSIELGGDLILEDVFSNKYLRFNLKKNETAPLNIKTNDFGENYETFFVNNNGVKSILKVERESEIRTMLYECDFPSGAKIKKLLEFDDEDRGYFFYSMGVHEVYYCPMLGGKGHMINLKTKKKRVIDNDQIPFMFYNNKYIIVDRGQVFISDLIDMGKNTFLFEGNNPVFCQTLNSIMYTSVSEPVNTVRIYKLDDNSVIDTGVTPLIGDRFDRDKYKYYFLNEPYMIYGIEDKGIINNYKAKIWTIMSGGKITDKPCKYMIYNYKTHQNVGYIKNAAVLDIKTYF